MRKHASLVFVGIAAIQFIGNYVCVASGPVRVYACVCIQLGSGQVGVLFLRIITQTCAMASEAKAPNSEAVVVVEDKGVSAVMNIASCHCGGFKAHVAADVTRTSVCFCNACQKRTGSLCGYAAAFPGESVRFEGISTSYTRIGDEGGEVKQQFCPTCATTVAWTNSGMPGKAIVALGCFPNAAAFPAPTFSVYEDFAHKWLVQALPADCQHMA